MARLLTAMFAVFGICLFSLASARADPATT
jgi:hypothetical protein